MLQWKSMGKQTRYVLFFWFAFNDGDFSSTNPYMSSILLFLIRKGIQIMRNILPAVFLWCEWQCENVTRFYLQHIQLCDVIYRHNCSSLIGFIAFRLTQRKPCKQTHVPTRLTNLKLMKLEKPLSWRQHLFNFTTWRNRETFNQSNDLTGKWNLPFDSLTFQCNQF